jgi:uncharacterized alkaline shock family protein YloU
MAVLKRLKRGRINVTANAIAIIAGNAALECYGVVGLVSKDGRKQSTKRSLLLPEDFAQGVKITVTKKQVDISIWISVAYGVKITQIVSEVQKKVRFVLQQSLDMNFKSINIFVEEVKDI